MSRKISSSGVIHDCENCGKRAPWGPGWIWFQAPIPSKHLGAKGQQMPVRWCSSDCEDEWLKTELAFSGDKERGR